MTYTVSSGTLNSSIPYHTVHRYNNCYKKYMQMQITHQQKNQYDTPYVMTHRMMPSFCCNAPHTPRSTGLMSSGAFGCLVLVYLAPRTASCILFLFITIRLRENVNWHSISWYIYSNPRLHRELNVSHHLITWRQCC